MALGRVRSISIRKARNVPGKFEIADAQDSFVLTAANTQANILTALVNTYGMTTGNATNLLTRASELGYVVVGIGTQAIEDTPSTPTLSNIVGVGAQS